MINKAKDVVEKTENNELENLKKYSILFVLAYIIVLAILSYTQIDESHSWLENFFSNIFEVFGHIASFAVLVVVFGALYMEHIKDTIKKGFGQIGNVIAKEMVKVGSVAEKLEDGIDRFIIPKVSSYVDKEEELLLVMKPELESNLKETKEIASKYAKEGDFEKVKDVWMGLLDKFPKEIILVEETLNFYRDNMYLKENKDEALCIIKSLKNDFINSSEYYRLLSLAYVLSEEIDENIYNLSIEAANRSLELNKDNPKGYRSLGYIYYWFGNTGKAIENTEIALQKIKTATPPLIIASIKNNLAFYYAMDNINKEKALAYVQESLEIFEENKDIDGQALAYDTLGYVQWKFKLCDLEQAYANCKKATELNPSEDLFYVHLQEIQQEISKNR